MPHRPFAVAHYVVLAVCLLAGRAVAADSAQPELVPHDSPLPDVVEFNRHIRPILSDGCFDCHGPDKAKRQADLRLDIEAEALADRGSGAAIVPGQPDASELMRRVTSSEETERMPPAETGRTLSARQVELLRRWIEQGAKWQPHWSLIAPARPAPPSVAGKSWLRNPIDAFVHSRLEQEGLSPSDEADRPRLLRRVSLDLTGLPPTPGEVDAFLADTAPDAFETAVDRLLASPHFGERMAVRWLDAARYADTNGYQTDGERFMWRWRDWVIDAYNRNLPFDQFTIEQIAGDMLPGASLDQRIASGFNRNHRGNAEGGIIPEEYAVEYVVDRVDTTSMVWLGLTIGCARCHDHKYDPVVQREYYQLFAYFNNVPERGKAVKYGNSPPMIKAPTRDDQARLAAVNSQIEAAQATCNGLEAELASGQSAWESAHTLPRPDDWNVPNGLLLHYALDGDTTEKCGRGGPGVYSAEDGTFVQGRIGKAGEFDGTRYINAGDVGKFGFYDKFSCGAWIYPRGDRGGAILSRSSDESTIDGYNLHLENGKLEANLVKRWLDDAARVETVERLEPDRWYHVMMTYDGSRLAQGIQIYVDGKPQALKVNVDDLNQSFETKEPLRIGSRGTQARFHGLIDDVRVYNRCLLPGEVELVATPDAISQIVSIPPAERTPRQASKLRAYYLAWHAPSPIQKMYDALNELERKREALVEGFPTVMVMQESPTPRSTCVLVRGQYDKPGDPVSPGVPASLSPLPEGVENNRLGFARWLVDPANPLTARVAVNRLWQMYFGVGLVKTTDDFGSQGEPPSHPELLDWLATEFVKSGWDVKAMARLIVTSATYRQSARVSSDLLQRDPENRLLARGPRLRLPAEVIRDSALAASGLLVRRIGGPSVKPYQPAGLWIELGDTDYVQDHGENLYRRGLYTYFKRTVAPPSMVMFDAAGREACSVREGRTNTPLQALTLMNDVTFVECARLLAERVMKQAASTDERLTLAFRLALARAPTLAELEVLRHGLEYHLDTYRQDPKAAQALASAGEWPRNESLDATELAAFTAVAGMILNVDEMVTKE